jgi:hypothetical protein
MASVMYHSRSVVQARQKPSKELETELQALQDGIKAEWMENWYDGLGYCKPNKAHQPKRSMAYVDLSFGNRHLECPRPELDR